MSLRKDAEDNIIKMSADSDVREEAAMRSADTEGIPDKRESKSVT